MAGKRKRNLETFSYEVAEQTFKDVTEIPFDFNTIAPSDVAAFLWLHSKANGTSPHMLLAALLPAVAACNGTRVNVKKWGFGHQKVSSNLYLMGVATSGLGKSPAYRCGLEEPLTHIEALYGNQLLLKNFTPSALLNTIQKEKGNGIISQDEFAQQMLSLLRRSGSENSGERQLLLTSWDGGSTSMTYTTKANVSIRNTSISVAGFTQPERAMDIVNEITSIKDGLLQRFIVWALPGRKRNRTKTASANDKLQQEFPSLSNLTDLIKLIFDLHDADEVTTYHLSEDGEVLLGALDDSAQAAMAETGVCVDSDSDDEDPSTAAEPLYLPAKTKLSDHVCKVAVNMHILYTTMQASLNGRDNVDVSREIAATTLQMAINLVKHTQTQLHKLLECIQDIQRDPSHVGDNLEFEETNEQQQVISRILGEPGKVVAASTITKQKIKRRNIKSSAFQLATTLLNMEGLGACEMLARKKLVFIKAKPEPQLGPALAKFNIGLEFYTAKYSLPAHSIDMNAVVQHVSKKNEQQARELAEETVTDCDEDSTSLFIFRSPETVHK